MITNIRIVAACHAAGDAAFNSAVDFAVDTADVTAGDVASVRFSSLKLTFQ